MSDNGMTIDEEARERTDGILEQLKNGGLEDNVKIIFIIGPVGAGKTSLVQLVTGKDLRVGHELNNGTPLPICVPATVDGQHYIFIDSPGFGHAASQPGEIKKQIQVMLGFFTRVLGGVHGFLYVQDIMAERTLPGMNEAIEFLDEVASEAIRPHITFITTKWDIPESARKLMRKSENREVQLKDTTWAKFKVGRPEGSRYFRHGVDCAEDSQQVQEHGQNLLWSNVMAHYKNATTKSLIMPFSEWTAMDQAFKVITIAGRVVIIGAAMSFVGFFGILLCIVPVTIGISATFVF